MTNRIEEALDIIREYGQIDGAHHKQWVLDQVARILTRDDYMSWVKKCRNEDDPNTDNHYFYDEGVAP